MVYYNTSQNIKAIKIIARALGDLNEKVVFTGGAVLSLYADDPAAPDVRPTRDLDIVVEISSQSELEILRQQLAAHNIHPAKNEKVLCRFIHQNILLDVMATREVGWAPANPWFKIGYDRRITFDLEDIRIQIFPFACFLAAKFTSFYGRGRDPRTSHDFEDIVYLLDNRIDPVKDILEEENEVKQFLSKEFESILMDDTFQEAVLAHLEPATQTERYKMLRQKLEDIIHGIQ
jgi:hypothetical protein